MTVSGPRPQRSGIFICRDSVDLAREAAGYFAELSKVCAEDGGRFSVALSGGRTPRETFEALASPDFEPQVPWSKVHFFWVDERPVSMNHPESNYRMAWEALLSKVSMPPRNVHRVKTEEASSKTVSAQYDRHLHEFFRLAPHTWPVFDLIFLGLGSDGHTASLFPGTDVLEEKQRLFVTAQVPQLRTERYTMTFPVLNHARQIVFLVSGAEKSAILKEVVESREAAHHFPAARINPVNGNLCWLVDEAAASRLSASTLVKAQRSSRLEK